jgi:ribosome biogenesis protein Nip4
MREEVDKIEETIEEILSSVTDGEMSFEDIMEIHTGTLKAYPEMLRMETSMLKKLNSLADILSGKTKAEISRYEVIALEAMGRRALKDLQSRIQMAEIAIFSSNELLGKDLFVMARGDDDSKPVLITYKGRFNSKLKEALNIK